MVVDNTPQFRMKKRVLQTMTAPFTAGPQKGADLLKQPLFQVLAYSAAVIIIIGGLKAASGLVVQILFALFLAIITTPLFAWLRSKRVPVPLALCAMLVVAFAAIMVLFMISRQTAGAIVADLPVYQNRATELINNVDKQFDRWGVPLDLPKDDKTFNVRALLAQFAAALQRLTSGVGVLFIIGILVVFFWLESITLPDKLQLLAPALRERLGAVGTAIRSYMGLKAIMSLLTGALAGFLCWLMSVPYAPMWALLAFMLNFIPTIGSAIAAIPPIVITLLIHGPGAAVIVGIGYLVINVGVSNVVEPRFMGTGLGMSPLVVILSMIVWGWILGPVGMLLSVPLTVALKIGLEAVPEGRVFAGFLSSRVDPQQDHADLRETSARH